MDNEEQRQVEYEEKIKRARLQELADLKHVLSSVQGRRFIRRLLAMGRVFGTTFTGNSQGMFLEGQRNMANFIISEGFHANPDQMKEVLFELGKEKEGNPQGV